MPDIYRPLSLHRLEAGAQYVRPQQQWPACVTLDDPAQSIMTDLGQVTACTVEWTMLLKKAFEIMIKRRVRMLLVHNVDDQIIGVLTSRDLESNRPYRILTKAGGVWDDLRVADLMTLRPKVDVLQMKDVLHARVGDIIATLRQVNRQHMLVVDTGPETGVPAVRGIFSLSQIARQLGLIIDPARRPTTYAEFVRAGGVL
ncbi:MAG TPA: CBS domain-containing protein [Candidatus Competibacteraceae bacterium]|nr:CBS domain-containing protein [Candidatus Competibacteraceae bacterium]